MILENFIKFIGYCLINGNTNIAFQYNRYDGSGAGTHNTTAAALINCLKEYGRIIIGNSDSPSSEKDDIDVDGRKYLEYLSTTVNILPSNDTILLVNSTIKNNSEETLKISNIGIGIPNSATENAIIVMITKNILDTSITMEPGDIYTFTGIVGI